MRRRLERGWLSLVERAGLAWEGLTLAATTGWRQLQPLRDALSRQGDRTRARPLTWGTVYVVAFCVLAMVAIDRPLATFLKARVLGDAEGFFRVVTDLGLAELYLVPAGLLWLGMAVAAWRAAGAEARARWRRMAVAPAFLFLSIAVSGIISNIIKVSLGRYRPRYYLDQGLYGFEPFNRDWGMNSFPSGHSQAAFAAMTALIVIFPRHAALFLTVAVLVAASRVMITVHYLSDAVAGSWLAVAIAVLIARAFRARGLEPRVGRE
ncbi:phosphatase PAP2 family protein [Magnetospirillum sp. UT-4]|uniref:phosphatase PAP2 family protein n=1 Tax=Magnetospirillum sp. UT-4 TaxID=2681467 RepID=UPI001382AB61|nr:phosphatase PAP2 family protein [Magnetospirillum sp. UT-4]CAA7621627.1 Phosphoesterase, PA-phosphatase [Magnetospirillum sp. UT-4]